MVYLLFFNPWRALLAMMRSWLVSGDAFGRLEDADMLSVNRALTVFFGTASRGAG